ncbi:MAG: AAA family ATPase [Moritella sp.]|uniref:AAA family ATPase n=1 Tax=Moritella sp. TaxID=78556 RepID=UPI00216FD014|nr:AAA family ATPase [Moritella sp.]MBL1418059.1 AAA family ATPase [Moritella sp.]
MATGSKDYLDKELKIHFEIKAFLLDPAQIDSFQVLDDKSLPLEAYPFNGIFNVDTIEAQRGFTDPNGENGKTGGSLSAQLSEYYNRHLNPTDLPDEDDIKALSAINTAQDLFDERLDRSFKSALGEIKTLGYPGFSDPDIKLSSKVNPIEGLNHDAAVVFDVQKQSFGNSVFSLPEKYNGLGYKNLIHIVFKLITYRDRWQRIGKAQRRRTEEDIAIEPIHLVLIEEPEAHLHAQVQQVFIRKAYDVLRKDVGDNFTTQMIVSSHSSYIAHEAGFEKLCYFKRKPATNIGAYN